MKLLAGTVRRIRREFAFQLMLHREVDVFWIPSRADTSIKESQPEFRRLPAKGAEYVGRYREPMNIDQFEADLRAHLAPLEIV